MPISVACSGCGKQYQLRDELAGKPVKCGCGHRFQVPGPGSIDEYPLATGGPIQEPATPTPPLPVAERIQPAAAPDAPSPGRSPAAGSLLHRVIGPMNARTVAGVVALGLGLVVLLLVLNWRRGPRYNSPEEVFDVYRTATVAKDWEKMLGAMTPESQETVVGAQAVMAVFLAKQKPELAGVLEKHGIDPGVGAGIEPRQLGRCIDDKAGFLADMAQYQEQAMAEMAENLAKMGVDRDKKPGPQIDITLHDVQIDGDTAVGKQKMKLLNMPIELPIEFKKIDGGWLVHQAAPGSRRTTSGSAATRRPPAGESEEAKALREAEEAAVKVLTESGVKVVRNRQGYPTTVSSTGVTTEINDATLAQLKHISSLQTLMFSGTKVTDDGLQHLKDLPNLGRIFLSYTQISDAGLEHLAGLSSLYGLDLTYAKVTGTGFAHWSQPTKLRSLELAATPLGDEAMQHIGKMTALTFLNLNTTQVTDDGVAQLKNLSNLQTLILSGTELTDVGLQHVKGHSQLRFLAVVGTAITDAGLAELAQMTNLRRLSLGKTKITDAGLEHLRGLTNLNVLELAETQVTDAGVEKLQQALPDTAIRRETVQF